MSIVVALPTWSSLALLVRLALFNRPVIDASSLAAAIHVHDDLPREASHVSFVVARGRIGRDPNRVKGDFRSENLGFGGQIFC
jgi:hypothetical protein